MKKIINASFGLMGSFFSSIVEADAFDVGLSTQETSKLLSAEGGMVYWLIIAGLISFLLLRSVTQHLPRLLAKENFAKEFNSKKFRLISIQITSFIVVLVMGIAWYIVDNNKNSTKLSLDERLDMVMMSTADNLEYWIDERTKMLAQVGKDPLLVAITKNLLTLPPDAEPLINSAYQTQARAYFQAREGDFGSSGFFIISPDHISIGSRRNTNLGTINLIAKQRPQLMQRVFDGEAMFVSPMHTDLMVKNAEGQKKITSDLTMFYAAPIKDLDGTVIAAVAQRLQPSGRLSAIMQKGRVGLSGESYLVNRLGEMVTESRFTDQLRNIGLINTFQMSDTDSKNPGLELKDPGGNLLEGYRSKYNRSEQPFTSAVQDLLEQAAFNDEFLIDVTTNVSGYRDYRGVMVYGAWRWLPQLEVGIVTEIDESEAMLSYTNVRNNLFVVVLVTLLLTLVSTILSVTMGQLVTRSMRKSKEELEFRVIERTAALKERESRLEDLYQNAPIAYASIDPYSWMVKKHNLAFTLLLGNSYNAFSGLNWQELLDKACQNPALHSGSDGVIFKDHEIEARHPDGSVLFVLLSATAAFDRDENLVEVRLTLIDITERKSAEDEIELVNFKSDQALDLTKSGYWHIPLDSNGDDAGWIYSSQRAAAIFGDYPRPPEWRYRMMEEWFANAQAANEETAQVALESFQKAVAGETPIFDAIFAYKRPIDGEVVWIHASGRTATDSKGRPTDMYGVTQDITKQHTIEQELTGAKEAAEAATRAKSDFLANMSHEIRTPMNAVIGLSYLALNTDLDRKQRDYLNKISVSANNLLTIINDILDFSKIEAGKLDMESVDFDLVEVLEAFSNVILVKAEEKELELIVDMEPDVPLNLLGDPLRLNQILINLANNAIKFTSTGEVSVSIKVDHLIEQGVVLRFEVKDSGIGMTSEQLKNLFQAFSQADSSTSRKFGGTGLGLTISKRLVEMMGGEIGVESEFGVGSTFFFTAKFEIGSATQSKESRVLPETLKDMRILVVDDNATSRTILARYLESFGFSAGEAASGPEAISELVAADEPYKLVFMDWKMPGVDGIETSKMIQESTELKELPKIIMVSAYGREELMERAENIGIESYLVKPVNPSTLLNSILEAFGHEEIYEQVRTQSEIIEHIRGAHILLAEDNEINQQVAEELLSNQDITVDIADNGKIAVDLLYENPEKYDAILMDIQMPVMDGYEATKMIREDVQFKSLPIIAMTANVMAGDREKASQSGMSDHVAKPIDVKELFSVLDKWISISEERRSELDFEKPVVTDKPAVPNISGVDTELGLKRVGGNVKLYLKILNKFRESQAGSDERILSAFEAGDKEAAKREAHTLKGLAGSLGATALQLSAEKVEHEVQESSEILLNLPDMRKLLQSVMEALEVLDEGGDSKPKEVVVMAPEKIKELVSRLRLLLEEDDGDAFEVLEELIPVFVEEDAKKQFKRLAGMVESYEFEEALERLDSIDCLAPYRE